MGRPAKRFPPNNVTAQRKPCKDCVAEGITTKRKAPYPGPRCSSHNRLFRTQRRDVSWEKRIELLYGITADEYWQIYEAQQGRCYLCQRATGKGRKRLSVDHCHKTGIVRGLLCSHDNAKVLGHARDDIEFFERCIEYLERPPAVDVIGYRIAPIEAPNLTLNGDE